MKKVLSFFLFFLILLNLGTLLVPIAGKYLSFDYQVRFKDLEKVYFSSQYVNPKVGGWIPDETLYSYTGGAFLKGANPILVLPEVPPLGKYLIGLSILLFNNENLLVLMAGLLSLLLIYLLGRQIYDNKIIAFLPVLFISSEQLFRNQFVFTPLLDIFQLCFLLASFYFFNLARKSKKSLLFFLIANLFLGAFISTKFFVSGLTIALSFLVVSRARKLLLTLPAALLVLILSYSKYFLLGHSLREFFGVQKWIFLYHQSKLLFPFSVWPLLLFNKWYVWWGDKPILSDPQWRLSWPIITIASLIFIILYFLNKIPRKKEIAVVVVWVVIYSLYSSIGQITSRYFIIFLPCLYLLTFSLVDNIVKRK